MSKNIKRNKATGTEQKPVDFVARRKRAESLASLGMLLLAGGLMVALFSLFNPEVIDACKWVFAAGTLIFFAGRCIPVSPDTESVRLKRMRRMEFWAGACFIVAAFLWFYNETRTTPEMLKLTGAIPMLRDTVVFSMAGAVLQIVAAWLIYFRTKKEQRLD